PATPGARPRMTSTPAPAAPASTATAAPRKGGKPAHTPSLVFVNGPHAGESVPLLPTTLTIGREHDNNIELKDPDVARYHARVLYERGNYVVEDLDSTTGTWVNGQRTRRVALNNGDVLRVGSTEIAIDFEWASDWV
ncbi:MAG: FHA domain-containing protein, partial [Candidatus Latescibacteria bacterium]|nr:FHA domain-containing protein [Candidatus Latescibacterota bacterium]